MTTHSQVQIMQNGTIRVNKFDAYRMIWLEKNPQRYRLAEEKLSGLGQQFIKFQDVTDFLQYMKKVSNNERLILLVNADIGRKRISWIHQFPQVLSIYYYYDDGRTEEQLSSHYEKVKPVVTNMDRVASQIHHSFRMAKQAEELSPGTLVTTSIDKTHTKNPGKSTIVVAGEFVFHQTLIDCLLRMKPSEQDKEELKAYLEKERKNNPATHCNLHAFHNDYSPNQVLHLYTCETFFYIPINIALRTKDIHMMFLWRSYLYDMHQQLSKYQLKSKIIVYRGQRIAKNEFDILRASVGTLISMNSFVSTSYDRGVALMFADPQQLPDDMEAVLFEIEADPIMVDSKPFADIADFSKYPDEREILFMFGSIFRVLSVNQESESLWIIKLSLCDDDDDDVQEVLKYMQAQNGKDETTLFTLAKLLWNMSYYQLAEYYYERFLQDLQPDDSLRLTVYEDIATIKSQQKDFDNSLKWQRKAHEWKVLYVLGYGNHQRMVTIARDARWERQATSILGGQGVGDGLTQLCFPEGLFVDKDGTVFAADWSNDRIVSLKRDAKMPSIEAGGIRKTYELEALLRPTDLIIDTRNKSLIISDNGKRRVIRLLRENGSTRIETILDNILCWGLTMDEEGSLYVTDLEQHAVRRYRRGENMTKGSVVAGGRGRGKRLDQLNTPLYVFVDDEHSVYVSDYENHRVMKWTKDANTGIQVAGDSDAGIALTHLCYPSGIIVDQQGTIYIADSHNHRVMRWCERTKGETIAGGHGDGKNSHQLNEPKGIFFDQFRNLIVVDKNNHRVQRFRIA